MTGRPISASHHITVSPRGAWVSALLQKRFEAVKGIFKYLLGITFEDYQVVMVRISNH